MTPLGPSRDIFLVIGNCGSSGSVTEIQWQQGSERSSENLTLADIASIAGVSTATVARVLKSKSHVSKRTLERVQRVLAETGYRPNAIARSLRTQRTQTIGHLLSRLTFSSLFAQISRDLEDEAIEHDYKVFIANLEGLAARERVIVDTFIESRVDALIFTHALDAANVRKAVAAGIPVVQTERLVDCDTHAVIVDHFVGSHKGVSHLVELGHRRIAFVGVNPFGQPHFEKRPLSIEGERFHAYEQALRDAGIGPDSDLTRFGSYPSLPIYDSDESVAAPGYELTQSVLALANRPTAIFVAAGPFITGALQAAYDAGLRIPDDLSIVGYDDSIAPFLTPPVTSVALPSKQIGQAACRLALAAIDRNTPLQSTLVPTQLRIRNSTGPRPSRT